MKKAVRLIAIIMSLALVFCLCSCGDVSESTEQVTEKVETADVDYSNVKIGFIFLHDPSASTYDNNFYQAALQAKEALGLTDEQVMFKWNIPEGNECYETALEFVDEGCNIIFADSFGHESYMLQAAEECPEVQFCHATGTHAVVSDLPNYHNAFASIYNGRYLAGIAAGMKLNEMIEEGKITAEQAKIGYVGAWPYAEVKSGYTSFFLGARSVCESATMEVTFTNSWFDIALEKEGAEKLINDGCVLISQHAASEGAPKACEQAGVPNVAYNVSTIDLGPTTAIISSKINWQPYFELIIKAIANNTEIPDDYCGDLSTGSVELTTLNLTAAAEGTQEAIDEAMAKIAAGELHVYDVNNFTVTRFDETYNQYKKDSVVTDEEGHLTSYLADVLDEGDYVGETEVVADGYFHESDVAAGFRSAPYFDLDIDGITIL